MTSFNLKSDPRRRTFVRLIGDIRHALNEALAEEYARRKLTKADIAKALKTNKSFVTRKLSGESNMTLATLADLAYALDRTIKITLPDHDASGSVNSLVELQEPDPADNVLQGRIEVPELIPPSGPANAPPPLPNRRRSRPV